MRLVVVMMMAMMVPDDDGDDNLTLRQWQLLVVVDLLHDNH